MNGYTERDRAPIDEMIQEQTMEPDPYHRQYDDVAIRSDYGLWERPRRRCSVCGCPGGHIAGCPEGS